MFCAIINIPEAKLLQPTKSNQLNSTHNCYIKHNETLGPTMCLLCCGKSTNTMPAFIYFILFQTCERLNIWNKINVGRTTYFISHIFFTFLCVALHTSKLEVNRKLVINDSTWTHACTDAHTLGWMKDGKVENIMQLWPTGWSVGSGGIKRNNWV